MDCNLWAGHCYPKSAVLTQLLPPLTCAMVLSPVLQPEPFEFLQHKQELVLQRVASTAASRVARSFTRQPSALSSSNALGSFTGQQLLRAFSSMRSSSLTHAHAPMPAHGAAGPDVGAAAAVTSPKGQQPLRQLSTKQLSLQLRRSVSISADGRLVPDVGSFLPGADQEAALGCEQEFQQEVRSLSRVLRVMWCMLNL